MTDIVFFPGMGADAHLADYHAAIPGKHHWINWVDPMEAHRLCDYAVLLRSPGGFFIRPEAWR